MSTSSKHYHKVIDDLTVAYNPNVNPATRTPTPYLISGSNVLCLPSSSMSRRSGFAPYLPSFGATAKIMRIFTWQRWAGAFYTMYSVVDTAAGTSSVYFNSALLFTDATSTEPFDYVVSNNFLFFCNGTYNRKWDTTTVTNWGISPQPVAAPTLVNAAAGNVPSVIGHQYCFAYGVAATGYISDISPLSAATTVANRQWDVTGARCSDAQCDQVHIYRTEDGGSTLYEVSTSPIANPAAATWTFRDNDYDITSTSTPRLQGTIQAPFKSTNQPPTSIKGIKYWAGRIWGFAGDVLKYSGLEEVTNGVPEESFGVLFTNSQSFGTEITGLEVLGSGTSSILVIFTVSHIFYISGNSLATFRLDTLSRRRGCRNRATIVAGQIDVANTSVEFIAWLDISNTVRMMTQGGSRDISFDIRPDIAQIDHSQASITIHEDGIYRWLVLCDGGAGVLRVFDLDRNQWNTPWPIAAGAVSTIYSGETSAGSHNLILGCAGAALRMDYATFADNLVPYASYAVFGLTSLLNPDNPEEVATLEFVGVETDADGVSDISYLLDEDPLTGSPTYTSILANETDPFLRATVDSPFQSSHLSGVNLIEKWYYLMDKSGARRVAVRIDWAAASGAVGEDFNLFSLMTVASRNGGS